MARVFTVDEAAEYLRVTPYTIRKWLRTGKIPGRKMGRMYRILEAELEQSLRGSEPLDKDENLPILENKPTWNDRSEAAREAARARQLEWQSLTREEKLERIDSAMGKYADVQFSSNGLVRERRLDRLRAEGPRSYRDWCSLSAEEKRAKADAAMGLFSHVPVSSDDVIQERRAEVEREKRRHGKWLQTP